ncbi:MAG: acyl-CoA dehydrogenase family protein [Brevundimonas sp.]
MTTDQDPGHLRGQLGEAVATMLDRQYSFEQRQQYREDPHGYSHDVWRAYAELGLLGLGVSEEHGGFGGGLQDMGVVFERLGAALNLEPLLTTIVFGGRLIDAAGSPEQKAAWLPPLVSGDLVVALAHDEPQSRYGSMSVRTAARSSSRGWVLSGEKRLVAGGDAAGLLVVSSLTQGEAGQEELALWLINPEAEGVRRRRRQSFDGGGLADIILDEVHLGPGDRLGGNGARSHLEHALDEATALQCADAVGAMAAANSLSVDYARTRTQFGAPIGSFQALQHRLVDMVIAEKMAAAMTEAALSALDRGRSDAAQLVSAAKVCVGQSARLVGQETVQMHGGMGLADEYPAAHYFARLGLFERRWGDADHHITRFAELSRQARN